MRHRGGGRRTLPRSALRSARVAHAGGVAARCVVRISEEFVARRHDAAWNLRMVTQLDGLPLRMLPRPIGDKAVDRGALLLTLGDGAVDAVAGHLGTTQQLGHTGEDLVVGTGNGDPASVAGLVMAVRTNVGGRRAHALADESDL